jgi:thiol:disulfide interchange protein
MTIFSGARGRLLLLSVFFVCSCKPISAQNLVIDPVRASMRLEAQRVAPGESVDAILTLEHDPLWHSYAADPGRTGLPTAVEWDLPAELSAGPIRWPEPETFSSSGIEAKGYSGRVELRIAISASKELAPGAILAIGAKASWLACKESCVPGEASFTLALTVARSRGASVWQAMLAAFGALLGGILLNLMPCVLPVLSIKLNTIIKDGTASRKDSLARGIAYTAGILAAFWLLAGILLALKAGSGFLGWGFQFQNPGFVAAMVLFFTAFALNMLGVFEFGTLAASFSGDRPAGKGTLRAFLSGAFATLVATPCAAPFMGAAIGYALGAGALESFAVFGALGLGMASPILLLSAFPRLASFLPKPGRWMETLQRLLGFILLGAVIWLLSILAALAGTAALISVLVALLGASAAAWIWGRWGNAAASRRSRRLSTAGAVLVFGLSLAYAILASRNATISEPRLPEPEGAAAKADGGQGDATPEKDNEEGIAWEVFSEAGLSEARAAGKPVFIDFRADWCLSCLLNEEGVLKNRSVVEAFGRQGVRGFKADWTKADPAVGKALASFGRRSVPLYLVYLPGKNDPLILPEILTRDIVLGALEGKAP